MTRKTLKGSELNRLSRLKNEITVESNAHSYPAEVSHQPISRLLLNHSAPQIDLLLKKDTKTEMTLAQLNCIRVVAFLRGGAVYLSPSPG